MCGCHWTARWVGGCIKECHWLQLVNQLAWCGVIKVLCETDVLNRFGGDPRELDITGIVGSVVGRLWGAIGWWGTIEVLLAGGVLLECYWLVGYYWSACGRSIWVGPIALHSAYRHSPTDESYKSWNSATRYLITCRKRTASCSINAISLSVLIQHLKTVRGSASGRFIWLNLGIFHARILCHGT